MRLLLKLMRRFQKINTKILLPQTNQNRKRNGKTFIEIETRAVHRLAKFLIYFFKAKSQYYRKHKNCYLLVVNCMMELVE